MRKTIMQDLGEAESLMVKTFAEMTPPVGAFDPNGDWTHVYDDATSYKAGWSQGGVTIQHRPDRQLRIESFRNCPQDYKYWTLADLQCAPDDWGTPLSWTVESKVSKKASDSAYLKSGLSVRANVRDGVLTLQKGRDKRILDLPGPYTCKWCLLDAVGRMARLELKERAFAMLDEYDEPCPGQRIALRERRQVKTRTGKIDILCYQHTGIATVPGLFYVDAEGRVLAYLGDMQLLVLQTEDRRLKTED